MKPLSNPTNYLEVNKLSWKNRLESHLKSDFYKMDDFLLGATSLNKIELDLLGDITDLKILHLQCHFGQDSISLSRMGADVTGVDFSEESIQTAKELAEKCNVTTKFVCSDIYSLPLVLEDKYDLVYTSYGTISWLPDIKQWAAVVSKFLKPNGKFVFVEFHPVVWMFDDDLEKVTYHYTNVEPIIEEESGTYADRTAEIKSTYVCWNHGLAEVITALQNAKIALNNFQEYNYSPYPFVNHSEEFEPGKFRIQQFGNKCPLVYSIVGVKS